MARLGLAILVIGLLALQAPSAARADCPASHGAEGTTAERLTNAVHDFVLSLRAKLAAARFVFQNPKTVAELAAHAPGNMSILINAVPRADLDPIIAKPDLKVTILAPTNRAFREALLKLKLTPKQLYADKTALTNILSYHVIADQALKVGDLKDGQEFTTVSHHKIGVNVDKVAGTVFKGATESAKVIAADIMAGQSIIHIVDTVMLPPPKPSK
ncbi:MAG: FAS1 domain-containing protein [Monoraphidium minutum]|nr:MAG: FAS1 domain-containing protein [Monoraphidium minutum]